jgi:predicted cupin superfamily sugar epimerase
MKDANDWIEKLGLQAHPEGGFFKQTYKSHEFILKTALPERFSGDRAFSTGIYYLLNKNDFSAFHVINQDEMWHFYDGSPLTIHVIDKKGTYSKIKLGRDIDNGEQPQAVVKAGCFFAAEVNNKEWYSLVGCTVAPGFDFEDFQMPSRDKLIGMYPQHIKIIKMLTRASA